MVKELKFLIPPLCGHHIWDAPQRRPKGYPPGPRFRLPMLGQVHMFSGDLVQYYARLRKRSVYLCLPNLDLCWDIREE